MELVETPPTPAFDASAFATYDNETDAAPTEQELVEELPAHLMPPPIDTENVKPTFRRGTGYLRAETVPDETADAEPAGEDAFGAGLDPSGPDTQKSPEMQQTVSAGETGDSTESAGETDSESSERQGTGRKRRRRRKRKPRRARESESAPAETGEASSDSSVQPDELPQTTSEVSVPSNETPVSSPAEATELSAEGESADTKDPGDKEEDGTPKKRRRRRRRRRGK